jgi:hypothetical protein
MKILYLFRYSEQNNYNHWINVDFIKILSTFPEIELKVYGYNTSTIFENLNLIEYSNNLTMKDLYGLFPYDFILIGGKNRTYKEANEKNSWLPKDFQNTNAIKILIEDDYHKYRKSEWFAKNNIDIILHRQKSNVIRGEGDLPNIKHLWFPFSVDTQIFKPNFFIDRINKVCFVGSVDKKNYVYQYRINASNLLEKNNLLDNAHQLYETNYITCLQSYASHLCCSSIYNIDCAKMFEIMGSGSILLIDDCHNGIKDLFDDNCYVTYKRDYSDLISKAKLILDNKQLQNYIVQNGLQCIKNKHTHQIRCQELINFLEMTIKNNCKLIRQVNEKACIDIVYSVGNLDESAIARFKNSYKSLIENDKNFNICISEVGLKSNKNLFDTFIPNYKYYYQKEEDFNASIAKNNAVKYLVSLELFAFLDIDMIYPSTFIENAYNFYETNKTPFCLSYVRLPNISLYSYQKIYEYLKTIPHTIKSGKGNSGLIVCDKTTYEKLNGFDEDYIGWGGRDSDFNLRAYLINKMIDETNTILFHQYHERKMQTQNYNRHKYNLKKELYESGKLQVFEINGLQNLKPSNIYIINPFEEIKLLIDNGIDVCLLKETCLHYIINHRLSDNLILGVNNIELARKLVNKYIIFESMPNKTKSIKLGELQIKVPYPVIKYLEKTFNKTLDNLKKLYANG